jgi:hypothetical protein
LEQVDNSLAPNLDKNELGQLMSLLATGDDVVMDIIPKEGGISVDDLFLPPQVENVQSL